MKRTATICLSLAILALVSTSVPAQYQISRSVLGNGGAPSSGENHLLNGTVGQAVIGIVSGDAHWHHIGFWAGPPTPTAVDESPVLPAIFDLGQNHPNPFNPRTTIRYAVPAPARVSIRLYDIRGREVATLLEADQEAGYHDLDFDAGSLASGVYFYRMDAGRFTETKKLVLLK